MISPVSQSSIAITCWLACKSHPIIRISASFDPSAVRSGHRTVYAGRREADVVMTSFCTFARELSSRPVDRPAAWTLPFFCSLLSGGGPKPDDQSHDLGPSAETL